jgi:hypothetical protein
VLGLLKRRMYIFVDTRNLYLQLPSFSVDAKALKFTYAKSTI